MCQAFTVFNEDIQFNVKKIEVTYEWQLYTCSQFLRPAN